MSNVEAAQLQWKQIAERLGFPDERTMWVHLYVLEERTIKALSEDIGFGPATIQRRLRLNDIERRSRGGANAPSKVAIAVHHLDARFWQMADVKDIAEVVGASIHSIYRLKREEL